MSDLWLVAGGNAEAERHANYLLSARTAAAGPMAFVLSAADPDEYQHREALMAERLDEAVSSAVGSDTGLFLDVRMALLSAMNADFVTVHEARMEAARQLQAREAACRAEEQRTAALVASINEGVAKLAGYELGPEDYGTGNGDLGKPFYVTYTCPKCGTVGSSRIANDAAGPPICHKCGNDVPGSACTIGRDAARKTAIPDGFWSAIHEQYEALKSAQSADDVMRICKPIPGTSAGEGFFEGSGGDEQVIDALMQAGWKSVRIEADYYWCLKAPNGDLVTYVEGDLYRGNQMSTNATLRPRTALNWQSRDAWGYGEQADLPDGRRVGVDPLGSSSAKNPPSGKWSWWIIQHNADMTDGVQIASGTAASKDEAKRSAEQALSTTAARRVIAAEIAIPSGTRPLNPEETISQIGRMNLLSISGGRVTRLTKGNEVYGLALPVSQGYNAVVFLDANDTYIVQRTFRGKVMGEVRDVYFDQLGEQMYQAGMYQSNEFGGHVKGGAKTAYSTWSEDDDEFDDGPEPELCPVCGGPGNELGTLGRLTHFRCQNCGWEWSENYADDGRYPQADDLTFESAKTAAQDDDEGDDSCPECHADWNKPHDEECDRGRKQKTPGWIVDKKESVWVRTRQPISVAGSMRDVTSWSATRGERDLTVVAANGGFTWAVFAQGQATPSHTGRAATLEAAQAAADVAEGE